MDVHFVKLLLHFVKFYSNNLRYQSSPHYRGNKFDLQRFAIAISRPLFETLIKDRVLALRFSHKTRDQKRFTISEVAADWHELIISQRTMWPSIARVNDWTRGLQQL